MATRRMPYWPACVSAAAALAASNFSTPTHMSRTPRTLRTFVVGMLMSNSFSEREQNLHRVHRIDSQLLKSLSMVTVPGESVWRGDRYWRTRSIKSRRHKLALPFLICKPRSQQQGEQRGARPRMVAPISGCVRSSRPIVRAQDRTVGHSPPAIRSTTASALSSNLAHCSPHDPSGQAAAARARCRTSGRHRRGETKRSRARCAPGITWLRALQCRLR